VLIEEPVLKRREWKSAVIQKLNTSTDGVVRSVELRTINGTLHQPVQRLCAFELNENYPLRDDPPEDDDANDADDVDADDGSRENERREADTVATVPERELSTNNIANQLSTTPAGAPPVIRQPNLEQTDDATINEIIGQPLPTRCKSHGQTKSSIRDG
jgi:hypothetical protein